MSEQKDEKKVSAPQHIAIIMDGNGRWAQRQGLPRLAGHNAGMKALKKVVRACGELGIGYLTVYAFSTENWKRPEEEVSGIFRIMVHYIEKELQELKRENVRVNVIGNRERIPGPAQERLQQALEETADNTGLVFTIALNYGGRSDIAEAVRRLAEKKASEGASLEALFDIDESDLEGCISTAGMPDPDLIIRTGGEKRISNFLLWQCAYSEFLFSDCFWPDFDKEELVRCIQEFEARHRRFGGL